MAKVSLERGNIIDELLALPTHEQQIHRLHVEKLLNLEGMSSLLDAAERLVGADPEQAYRAALICEEGCLDANLTPLSPRVLYLRAQIHAIRGEFEQAENLIEKARASYVELGMTLEAVRTNVGLMRVFGETGRYAEALAIGQGALNHLGMPPDPESESEPEFSAVAAMLLQNCGFCYEQVGRYDEALEAYAAAEKRYQLLGMTHQLAHIVENRGAVLMALGRVQDALAAFAHAQQIYAQDALAFYQAQTLINVGEAHLLLGNYLQSLQAFEKATHLFGSLGDSVDRHILLRHMGDAYLALNLHAEALDAYSRAKAGLQESGITLHYALTLWGLGVTHIARNSLTEAQDALAEATHIVQSLENRPLQAALLLEQSRLLELSEDATTAREQAQVALNQVVESNWIVQKIYAYLRNADLNLPDTSAAEPFLVAAERLIDQVELPQLRYRLQQRWGHLRLLQGESAAAQFHLEQAIDEIERLRSTLVQERLRSSFLEDKSAAYQDLVCLYLESGDADSLQTAFVVTERAKSRALAELMAGGVQRSRDQPNRDTFDSQLHSLQAELNAIYNEILYSGSDIARPAAAATLKTRATELERAISHLRLQQAIGQGKATAPATPRALPSSPKPSLPDNVAMLAYHCIGNKIIAFVWVNGELHLLDRLAGVEQVQEWLQRLEAQWARVRSGQSLLHGHRQQLELSAQRLLHQIYDGLMAPALALLENIAPVEGVREAVIVPDGPLHQLPFHAFYDGERYLVEYCAISYAPSATVYSLCQQRTLRRDGLALAVAAPDKQIPAAAAEAQQVAQQMRSQFDEVCLLLNEEATTAALTSLAPRAGRLHLACHGLFRSDNPLFSALKLYDGWLSAANVVQLELRGALVTLSACESGRSRLISGESIGLVYAFLSAGAAALLVSQWLVQDEVTAHFMEWWYTEQAREKNLAQALRAAQLTIMVEHPHPFFWAPFTLIGKRLAPATSLRLRRFR